MDLKLISKLEERMDEGTLRSLSCFEGMTDFFSNDYLGLAKMSFEDTQATGSTGSRLISGTSEESLRCEQFLAEHFLAEAALVFNSGYDANLGFFGSVPQKGDTIIYDQFIHASVRDGIKLSNAKAFSFKHNSVEDLEKKIQLSEGTVYVAIESLYSMDGDLAPLKEIASLCEQYEAYLIVDEAHAAGVLGKGLSIELGLCHLTFARLITFGKAYGAHGAAVLGSEQLKEYLINFARSFIYTTALPPGTYQWIQYNCSQSIMEFQVQLQQNIQLFRENCFPEYLCSDARSPIQIIRVGEIHRTKVLAEVLHQNGFAVKPIFSPTVPKGSECIRICLHAFNTEEQILDICRLLNQHFK
ncbi:MAG: pyridoxal phosphate-dependent aminotransferase family protein [Cryomorphaceae bacterium]|nr:pyridoxal phosphate-dependent aminotransferase family protein [Cryomorphaceae bacterium]